MAGNHSADDGAEHTNQVVEIEAKCAPLLFQRGTNEVVKIQAEQNPDDAGGGRQENKCDEPPNLSLQNQRAVERDPRAELKLREK